MNDLECVQLAVLRVRDEMQKMQAPWPGMMPMLDMLVTELHRSRDRRRPDSHPVGAGLPENQQPWAGTKS